MLVGLLIVGSALLIAGSTQGGGQSPVLQRDLGASAAAIPEAVPGSVLEDHMLVCFYGNRAARSMGILGEYSLPELEQRLHRLAEQYDALNGPSGVKPCFDYVYLVANASGQPYSHYTPHRELFDEALEFATERGIEFFVDLQPGYRDLQTEIHSVLPLLKAPNVHLALDTEFYMVHRGGVPSDTLGSMDANDVNHAAEILQAFVEEQRLPPKILMVYQFEDRMLTNKDRLHTGLSGVKVVINADGVGFGGVEGKITDYEQYGGEPHDALGIKLFYEQDLRVLTPHEVMGLEPQARVVVYQ